MGLGDGIFFRAFRWIISDQEKSRLQHILAFRDGIYDASENNMNQSTLLQSTNWKGPHECNLKEI